MSIKFVLIFCSIILSLQTFAQSSKKNKPKKAKEVPENIEVFPKNFLVRPRFVFPSVWVDVSSRLLGKGEKFRYKPSIPGVVGLSLKIKKVYISFAIKLPSNDRNIERYGNTKFRNIFVNIQGRILNWSLFYRDYKGFYLENYNQFYPNWNKDSLGYPKTDKLRIIEAGLNLGFNFNKNFSMNAAFAQGERQKKSAGSFLMALSERYQRIEADSEFVPASQSAFYPNLNKLKFGNFSSTILSIGFGYQFVFRKFHFTPVLMVGSGFQIQRYSQTDKDRFWINVPIYTNFKTQLGYNGDHFFANIIYQREYNTIPLKESRIKLYHNWLEFGIGLRF